MKKLYSVKVSLEIQEPVIATSAHEAELLAADHVAEMIKNAMPEDYFFNAVEVAENDPQYLGCCAWPDGEDVREFLRGKQ